MEYNKTSLDDLLSIPVKTIEEHIIDYLVGNKSYIGKRMTINALKKFYEMNDVILNWKKISQYIGEYQRVSRDRAISDKEIKTLVDSADLRMKVILLLMASSGMRIGAIPDLKLKHVSGNKITVYKNTIEEYYTFITGECRQVLDAYLDYRTRSGEKLNPDSPLVRKQFDINDLEQVRKHSAPVALNTLNVILDHHLQRCDSMDNILKSMAKGPYVIKIDIEGEEVNALLGANNTLKNTRKIIVEIHNDANLEESTQILLSHQFNIEIVKGNMPYMIGTKD
jgi:integrase